MSNILMSGSTGFVGSNLRNYLKDDKITSLIRKESNVDTLSDFLFYDRLWEDHNLQFSKYIHLAGKAHDTKKVTDGDEYFRVNYDITVKLYDRFLKDEKADTFIFLSSVKAVADVVDGILTEDVVASPKTFYGKSKLKAENYIIESPAEGKKVVILRPCMIHGPGNKGNLNLLYEILSKGIPWPLGSYDNSRSFLSIENLCYVIKRTLNGKMSSGIYNIADDETLSTSDVVSIISEVKKKKARIWNIPKPLIEIISKVGNTLSIIPLNEERLNKLTENYLVSNEKIKKELGIELMPVSIREGMYKTFNDFQAV